MNVRQFLINYVRPTEITAEQERRTFLFLFILTFVQIVSFQAWQTLYTNYIVEILNLNAAQNGIVQSFRELPGLLAITVVFWLRYVKEENMAVISVFFIGIGVMITGLFQSYTGMILTTLCMSFGYHYFETINQSMTLQAFAPRVAPLVFGRLRSISALGTILVTLCLLFFVSRFSYTALYFVTGFIGIAGAFIACFRKPDLSQLPRQKTGIVLKKKYWLFYAMTFLSGGRRQIFMIFSLFLLVEKFEYSVVMITVLFLIADLVSWLLNPLIGRMINILGERKLLTLHFAPAFFVFLGYAFIDNTFIVGFLYVFDRFIYNFNIAEKTFFQKIGEKEDISPSMAVSFTINHIAAVIVPTVGGAMYLYDYRYPFYMGAILALMSCYLVQFIDREIAKNKA